MTEKITTTISTGTEIESEMLYTFYANTIKVLSSDKEVLFLFGQCPANSNGKIPMIRVYIQRDFLDTIIKVAQGATSQGNLLNKTDSCEKTSTEDHIYG